MRRGNQRATLTASSPPGLSVLMQCTRSSERGREREMERERERERERDPRCRFLRGSSYVLKIVSLQHSESNWQNYSNTGRTLHDLNAETYLPLVVRTHVQVAQDGFQPDFLIKFLVRGPVIGWPKIQLWDKANRLCWRVKIVKMLMVSLSISGKQKIATADIMRQSATGIENFQSSK